MVHQNRIIRFVGALASVLLLSSTLISCSNEQEKTPFEDLVSSRSYSGHQSDKDANNLVSAYRQAVGTRVDDCQTCHGATGTTVVKADPKEREIYNVCDYCHRRSDFDEQSTVLTDNSTLNPYGLAYKNAGRTKEAVLTINDQDSDGDGFSNTEEIAKLRNPGNAASSPGQELAVMKTFTLDDLKTLKPHAQFMLLNTTKQQYDDYSTYSGVAISDLLVASGADLEGADGITVYAPDGFGTDFTMEEVNQEFARGTFYQTPDFGDETKELVNYPNPKPGVADGTEIPNTLKLILAYMLDGQYLPKAVHDKESGKLNGKGPYRLMKPQTIPSRPDRTHKMEALNDGWDFDKNIDHNAGYCVRAACVIRINPMPENLEEYDWKNGWSLIEDGNVIIYGHGIK